jgi:hypothetical protein
MVSGRATLANLGESLAAQAMTDLGERGSLGVRELQLPFQLRLQDAINASRTAISFTGWDKSVRAMVRSIQTWRLRKVWG